MRLVHARQVLFSVLTAALMLLFPITAQAVCIHTNADGTKTCIPNPTKTCPNKGVYVEGTCEEYIKRDSSCPPDAPKDAVCLKNPLQTSVTAPQVISIIIKTALGIVGAITLLMIVWGGSQWLTSAGNAERVEAGTKTMIWAVVGLFIVFASYIIVQAVITSITTAPR